MKKVHALYILFICLLPFNGWSQELLAKVTVITSRVNTTVDKRIFITLQTQLNNLMNTRKWTSDVFQQNEKIECSFILNIENIVDPNVYKPHSLFRQHGRCITVVISVRWLIF